MPPSREREESLAQRPVAAALQFQRAWTVFVKYFLAWDQDDGAPIAVPLMQGHEGGVFGHTRGYFAAVEEQSRGALHIHALVWLKGYQNLVSTLERQAGGVDSRTHIKDGIVHPQSPPPPPLLFVCF
jgi:hypothetical protein